MTNNIFSAAPISKPLAHQLHHPIHNKVHSLQEVAFMIADGATIAVNSSSGLCCPDAVLQAIGERFAKQGSPKEITTIHPIAAGDMFGSKGIDHIAIKGLLTRIIAGSYPSGPSNMSPPLVWQLLGSDSIAAYNLPSGVIFDMLREGAALRPGVLTKVGMDTFVDPNHEGGAMNAAAKQQPIVQRKTFENQEWLYFPALTPDVAIIRASTADEKGNLTFEHEGAVLGAMEMALAAHNNGGKVIAQVKRIAQNNTLAAHSVVVPGILVDAVVEVPDQLQTTATTFDPAICGEIRKPLDSFAIPAFSLGKVIARRVAQELQVGWAVNIGFGVSANVPRILLEEGLHGAVTWMIEQGAVGGIPLLDFKFGCAANAEAFVQSPHQFSYFQAAGFDATLLSFLEIDQHGSVNVSRLVATPHRTAGAGGFVDITSRARKIVFSGNFNVGAKIAIQNGQLIIEREGKLSKIVPQVDQISFSGKRALAQGQQVRYVTERCVIELTQQGLEVIEVAPGIDVDKDVVKQVAFPLQVSTQLRTMDRSLFRSARMGLQL